MKRISLAVLSVIFAALLSIGLYFKIADNGDENESFVPAFNENTGSTESSVDELLDKLNLTDIQGLMDALSGNQLEVFGFSDIRDRIVAVASGEVKNDFGNIVSYILALLGTDVFEFLPMLIGCLTIVLAYNIINSIKGRFASDSIERVVFFATGLIAVSLVVGYFAAVIVHAVKLVGSIKSQINAVSPVLLTLMTAAGATSSASVYAPTVAVLGSGMTNVITYLAFPALLMGLVFDIIGSVSNAIKLDKTAEFFRSVCKWFLGTAFFLFIAVIGVSGITASVRDGISLRAARFALSKYVPVIGGYLSQGFDFMIAGNVLIKNAIGSSAVVLIILVAAPIISKLAVFTLTLKLTAALAEPLGGEKFGGILSSVAKSSSVMNAVVCAMTFLYVLFLSMLICTGNISL